MEVIEMSWSNILKRSSRGIHPTAKVWLDEIMEDGEQRTAKEILNKMWEKIESVPTRGSGVRYSGKLIPTIGELRYYLARNYASEEIRPGHRIYIKW